MKIAKIKTLLSILTISFILVLQGCASTALDSPSHDCSSTTIEAKAPQSEKLEDSAKEGLEHRNKADNPDDDMERLN